MDLFALDRFELKRKFFSLIHTDFTILAPGGEQVLAYGRKKGFKLKEDITVCEDQERQRVLLTIRARSVIDFSATYDVATPGGMQVGSVQRRGMRSILRDEWQVVDASSGAQATIREDSVALALLRRFLSNLIPQSYDVARDGSSLGTVKQNFNPFLLRLNADFSADGRRSLDRRLAVAAVVLLGTIETRQN